MKKLLMIFFIMIMLFGCAKKEEEKNINDDIQKVDYNKAIVIYFSRAGENYSVGKVNVGNTAMMASYIKEYLNSDSFEIVPKVPYSNVYDEVYAQANREKNEKARPEIKNSIDNLDEYDTIFLGYPIWCGELPMIMYTFMEKYDLNGKTIVPFNTHEGSGNAGTFATIKEKFPNATVKNGLSITGSVARTEKGKTDTIEWLKNLGY